MYTEGTGASLSLGKGSEDPVLGWLNRWCAYRDICQCHIVGGSRLGDTWFPHGHSWHHPGTLCSNVLGRHRQLIDGVCPYFHANLPCPQGCNRNNMNAEITTKLSRLALNVMNDNPPSVPRKGVPLPSVLKSRRRKTTVENMRYIKWRHRRGLEVVCSDRAHSALDS